MTTVAATSLSDSLPSSIPKLDSTGLNWAIFALRFQDAVEAKGFWGHFDGTTPRPVAVAISVTATDGTVTTSTAVDTAAVDQWDKDERSAKSLLTQKIPDSTLMRIHAKQSVKDRWSAIVIEYTEKGAYAQTDLRARFLESKCPDKGNVREFLDNLRVKREELASVGVDIDEKDYRSTIISSLPIALANFASSQLAAARLYAPTKTIAPDSLISLISEEYERQKTQRSRRSGGGKSKEDEKDEALSATAKSSKAKGGKGERKPKGVCWNCGEEGHYQNKCPKPAKSAKSAKSATETKKDTTSPTKDGSANAAIESDSEGEGAFVMESESGSGCYSSGVSEFDDLDVEDWFSEIGDESNSGRIASELFEANSDCGSLVSDDTDSETPIWDEAVVSDEAHITTESTPRAEVYDSGCSKHISPYRDDFRNYSEISPKSFRAANKQSFSAVGIGEMTIDIPNGVISSQLHLTEVLYSPEVGYTLISVGKLDESGFCTTFYNGKCTIKGPDGNYVGNIPKTSRGLYRVDHEPDSVNEALEQLTLDQFHRRMGHISPEVARKLVTKGFVTGVSLDETESGNPFFCESCVYAKATRKPVFKVRQGDRATEFGGEIHTDLWGPAPVATKSGRRYYITFTDDMTRLTHLHLLRTKAEAFMAYKDFEAWCKTQLNASVKILHSDRGGEYRGKEFILHLKSKGTKEKLTVHDTPAHNGVAERRNRTIVERIRALLHASGLPKYLWGEAARHVVWLMNRTTTKAISEKTPYEAAFGKKPNLSEVREWGEKVWVRVEGGTKLGGRVCEGRWLGFDEKSNGVRVYWPDKQTVSIERNIYFDKTIASVQQLEGEDWEFVKSQTDLKSNTPVPKPSEPVMLENPTPTIDDQPPEHEEIISEPEIPQKRVRKPTQRLKDLLEGRAVVSDRPNAPKIPIGVQLPTENVDEVVLEGERTADLMMMVDEYAMVADASEMEGLEPRSLAEAKRRPDWLQWERAIDEELEVLKKAGTWRLVDAPPEANIVGSKWVFRAKKDAAGNVVRYKARLVAQGFSQVPGVDYFDTFAPVAKLASIRAALAVAAVNNMEIHQIDIKGAYLNGKLTSDEQIYMAQPPGYHAPDSAGKVCHLIKTLYGLKQSG